MLCLKLRFSFLGYHCSLIVFLFLQISKQKLIILIHMSISQVEQVLSLWLCFQNEHYFGKPKHINYMNKCKTTALKCFTDWLQLNYYWQRTENTILLLLHLSPWWSRSHVHIVIHVPAQHLTFKPRIYSKKEGHKRILDTVSWCAS